MSNVIDQGCKRDLTHALFYVTFNSGVGALAGHAFNMIHPVGGAIIGGTLAVTSLIVSSLLGVFLDKNSTAGKILIYVINFFASLGVSTLIANLAGYAITFSTCFWLSVAMIPVEFLTALALGLCARCFFGSEAEFV